MAIRDEDLSGAPLDTVVGDTTWVASDTFAAEGGLDEAQLTAGQVSDPDDAGLVAIATAMKSYASGVKLGPFRYDDAAFLLIVTLVEKGFKSIVTWGQDPAVVPTFWHKAKDKLKARYGAQWKLLWGKAYANLERKHGDLLDEKGEALNKKIVPHFGRNWFKSVPLVLTAGAQAAPPANPQAAGAPAPSAAGMQPLTTHAKVQKFYAKLGVAKTHLVLAWPTVVEYAKATLPGKKKETSDKVDAALAKYLGMSEDTLASLFLDMGEDFESALKKDSDAVAQLAFDALKKFYAGDKNWVQTHPAFAALYGKTPAAEPAPPAVAPPAETPKVAPQSTGTSKPQDVKPQPVTSLPKVEPAPAQASPPPGEAFALPAQAYKGFEGKEHNVDLALVADNVVKSLLALYPPAGIAAQPFNKTGMSVQEKLIRTLVQQHVHKTLFGDWPDGDYGVPVSLLQKAARAALNNAKPGKQHSDEDVTSAVKSFFDAKYGAGASWVKSAPGLFPVVSYLDAKKQSEPSSVGAPGEPPPPAVDVPPEVPTLAMSPATHPDFAQLQDLTPTMKALVRALHAAPNKTLTLGQLNAWIKAPATDEKPQAPPTSLDAQKLALTLKTSTHGLRVKTSPDFPAPSSTLTLRVLFGGGKEQTPALAAPQPPATLVALPPQVYAPNVTVPTGSVSPELDSLLKATPEPILRSVVLALYSAADRTLTPQKLKNKLTSDGYPLNSTGPGELDDFVPATPTGGVPPTIWQKLQTALGTGSFDNRGYSFSGTYTLNILAGAAPKVSSKLPEAPESDPHIAQWLAGSALQGKVTPLRVLVRALWAAPGHALKLSQLRAHAEAYGWTGTKVEPTLKALGTSSKTSPRKLGSTFLIWAEGAEEDPVVCIQATGSPVGVAGLGAAAPQAAPVATPVANTAEPEHTGADEQTSENVEQEIQTLLALPALTVLDKHPLASDSSLTLQQTLQALPAGIPDQALLLLKLLDAAGPSGLGMDYLKLIVATVLPLASAEFKEAAGKPYFPHLWKQIEAAVTTTGNVVVTKVHATAPAVIAMVDESDPWFVYVLPMLKAAKLPHDHEYARVFLRALLASSNLTRTRSELVQAALQSFGSGTSAGEANQKLQQFAAAFNLPDADNGVFFSVGWSGNPDNPALSLGVVGSPSNPFTTAEYQGGTALAGGPAKVSSDDTRWSAAVAYIQSLMNGVPGTEHITPEGLMLWLLSTTSPAYAAIPQEGTQGTKAWFHIKQSNPGLTIIDVVAKVGYLLAGAKPEFVMQKLGGAKLTTALPTPVSSVYALVGTDDPSWLLVSAAMPQWSADSAEGRFLRTLIHARNAGSKEIPAVELVKHYKDHGMSFADAVAAAKAWLAEWDFKIIRHKQDDAEEAPVPGVVKVFGDKILEKNLSALLVAKEIAELGSEVTDTAKQNFVKAFPTLADFFATSNAFQKKIATMLGAANVDELKAKLQPLYPGVQVATPETAWMPLAHPDNPHMVALGDQIKVQYKPSDFGDLASKIPADDLAFAYVFLREIPEKQPSMDIRALHKALTAYFEATYGSTNLAKLLALPLPVAKKDVSGSLRSKSLVGGVAKHLTHDWLAPYVKSPLVPATTEPASKALLPEQAVTLAGGDAAKAAFLLGYFKLRQDILNAILPNASAQASFVRAVVDAALGAFYQKSFGTGAFSGMLPSAAHAQMLLTLAGQGFDAVTLTTNAKKYLEDSYAQELAGSGPWWQKEADLYKQIQAAAAGSIPSGIEGQPHGDLALVLSKFQKAPAKFPAMDLLDFAYASNETTASIAWNKRFGKNSGWKSHMEDALGGGWSGLVASGQSAISSNLLAGVAYSAVNQAMADVLVKLYGTHWFYKHPIFKNVTLPPVLNDKAVVVSPMVEAEAALLGKSAEVVLLLLAHNILRTEVEKAHGNKAALDVANLLYLALAGGTQVPQGVDPYQYLAAKRIQVASKMYKPLGVATPDKTPAYSYAILRNSYGGGASWYEHTPLFAPVFQAGIAAAAGAPAATPTPQNAAPAPASPVVVAQPQDQASTGGGEYLGDPALYTAGGKSVPAELVHLLVAAPHVWSAVEKAFSDKPYVAKLTFIDNLYTLAAIQLRVPTAAVRIASSAVKQNIATTYGKSPAAAELLVFDKLKDTLGASGILAKQIVKDAWSTSLDVGLQVPGASGYDQSFLTTAYQGKSPLWVDAIIASGKIADYVGLHFASSHDPSVFKGALLVKAASKLGLSSIDALQFAETVLANAVTFATTKEELRAAVADNFFTRYSSPTDPTVFLKFKPFASVFDVAKKLSTGPAPATGGTQIKQHPFVKAGSTLGEVLDLPGGDISLPMLPPAQDLAAKLPAGSAGTWIAYALAAPLIQMQLLYALHSFGYPYVTAADVKVAWDAFLAATVGPENAKVLAEILKQLTLNSAASPFAAARRNAFRNLRERYTASESVKTLKPLWPMLLPGMEHAFGLVLSDAEASSIYQKALQFQTKAKSNVVAGTLLASGISQEFIDLPASYGLGPWPEGHLGVLWFASLPALVSPFPMSKQQLAVDYTDLMFGDGYSDHVNLVFSVKTQASESPAVLDSIASSLSDMQVKRLAMALGTPPKDILSSPPFATAILELQQKAAQQDMAPFAGAEELPTKFKGLPSGLLLFYSMVPKIVLAVQDGKLGVPGSQFTASQIRKVLGAFLADEGVGGVVSQPGVPLGKLSAPEHLANIHSFPHGDLTLQAPSNEQTFAQLHGISYEDPKWVVKAFPKLAHMLMTGAVPSVPAAAAPAAPQTAPAAPTPADTPATGPVAAPEVDEPGEPSPLPAGPWSLFNKSKPILGLKGPGSPYAEIANTLTSTGRDGIHLIILRDEFAELLLKHATKMPHQLAMMTPEARLKKVKQLLVKNVFPKVLGKYSGKLVSTHIKPIEKAFKGFAGLKTLPKLREHAKKVMIAAYGKGPNPEENYLFQFKNFAPMYKQFGIVGAVDDTPAVTAPQGTSVPAGSAAAPVATPTAGTPAPAHVGGFPPGTLDTLAAEVVKDFKDNVGMVLPPSVAKAIVAYFVGKPPVALAQLKAVELQLPAGSEDGFGIALTDGKLKTIQKVGGFLVFPGVTPGTVQDYTQNPATLSIFQKLSVAFADYFDSQEKAANAAAAVAKVCANGKPFWFVDFITAAKLSAKTGMEVVGGPNFPGKLVHDVAIVFDGFFGQELPQEPYASLVSKMQSYSAYTAAVESAVISEIFSIFHGRPPYLESELETLVYSLGYFDTSELALFKNKGVIVDMGGGKYGIPGVTQGTPVPVGATTAGVVDPGQLAPQSPAAPSVLAIPANLTIEPDPPAGQENPVPLPEIDLPEEEELTKLPGGSQLGGAGKKVLYKDAKGKGYLFKLAVDKTGSGKIKPFSVVAQVWFSKVAQVVKDEHIPMQAVVLGGELGTLQPFYGDVDQPGASTPKSLKGVSPASLTPSQQQDVAEEHVLDWLMSQHDSHAENFLMLPNGKIVGIDKEQCFRFLGGSPNKPEKLSLDYDPNGVGVYYNKFWKDWVEGKFDFDPTKLLPTIQKIESIDDGDYAAEAELYATTLYPDNPVAALAVVQKVMDRKERIRSDFEQFFTALYQQKTGATGTFTFADGWVAVPAKITGAQGTALVTKTTKTETLQQAMSAISAKFKEPGSNPGQDPKLVNATLPGGIALSELTSIQASGPDAEEKLKALAKAWGITPVAPIFKGTFYTKLLVKKSDLPDLNTVKTTETETVTYPEEKFLVIPANLTVTSPLPPYPAPKTKNIDELKDIDGVVLGKVGKNYSADGAAVEGNELSIRRWMDPQGNTYYRVFFKLRPSAYTPLLTGGAAATYKFFKGTYNPTKDAFVQGSDSGGGYAARTWKLGSDQAWLFSSEDRYAWFGGVVMHVYAQQGSLEARVRELLNAMSPGLSAVVYRNPTEEELTLSKLSHLLWALDPKQADGLPPENQRTVADLRNRLSALGLPVSVQDKVRLAQVADNHYTWELPGRHKTLAQEYGYLFLHGGTSSTSGAVGVLTSSWLSTTQRMLMGIPSGAGASESADVNTGGASFAFLRAALQGMGWGGGVGGGTSYKFIVAPDVIDRLDSFAHESDSYGSCKGGSYEGRTSVEKWVAYLKQHGIGSSEIMIKTAIPVSRILAVVADSQTSKSSLVTALLAAGVQAINGVPVQDYVTLTSSVEDVYNKVVKPRGYLHDSWTLRGVCAGVSQR